MSEKTVFKRIIDGEIPADLVHARPLKGGLFNSLNV